MRALVLIAALSAGCLLRRAPFEAERPRWQVTGGERYASGCALARAFVRKSGKPGLGLAIQVRSLTDCRIEITGGSLAIDGRIVPVAGVPARELPGRSMAFLWLPIHFDGNTAWNRGAVDARLVLAVTVAGTPAAAWQLALHDGMEAAAPNVSPVNAPGLVPDLDTPAPDENDSPTRRVLPFDPGTNEHWLWAMPYLVGGVGRGTTGAGETGVEARYEHHTLAAGETGFTHPTLTGSLAAAYQWRSRGPAFGVGFAELGVRWAARKVPVEAGIGPVVELDHRALGVQVTLRPLMVFPIRARYTRDGGAEVFIGFELPLPFVVRRSR